MKFRRLLPLLFALLCVAASASAHYDARLPVIVDTDMALDDIRAIALLSCADNVEILACVTSDGASSPEAGAANLRRVLARLGLGDVPVAAGRALDAEAPPWRPMSEALDGLGRDEPAPAAVDQPAVDLLRRTLAGRENAIYLCLGPMSNLADLLRETPAATERISTVQFYGTRPGESPASWNTTRDLPAARAVFAAGLPVQAFHLADDQLLRYDARLGGDIRAQRSAAAKLLCDLHGAPRTAALVESGHFRCWDDSAVLDLLFPGLFDWRPNGTGEPELRCDLPRTRQHYLDLLTGDLSMKHGHRDPVNLRAFPTDETLLRPDVAAIADAALARHGREEWVVVLLTNEMHRHLGIYSILGAKMGIRARELLEAGVDELRVVSRTGGDAPLSCLTDGLQVATGATLGRGTISVDPQGQPRPAALFTRGDRSVELTLKPRVIARVRGDIKDCIAEHGALTPSYWRAVRALGLRYWAEMERVDLFDEAWAGADD